MKKGKLVIFCGPSGVGKGSVEKHFINNPEYNFHFSVSSTSRTIRENEENRAHYNYLTKSEFENDIKNNKFLEYATFIDNYYGTPIAPILENLEKGNNVFIEIEIIGVKQVIEKMPEAITIFLAPPSIDDLIIRLNKRSSESPEIIKQRVERAKEELIEQDIFKYVVVNNVIEESALKIKEILNEELNV